MKFTTTNRTGSEKSFLEAVAQGCPADGGVFVPKGAVDLRTAVYSPDTPYVDTVLTAIMTLLPDDFDPVEAGNLVEQVFPREPEWNQMGNLLLFDFASGKSGSVLDYGADLLMAAVKSRMGGTKGRGAPFVALYPEGSSRDARAGRAILAAWTASFGAERSPEADLVLLKARKSGAAGISATSSSRSSPGLHVVELPCREEEIPDIIRSIARNHPGRCVPALADSPAFFMATLILETAMFAEEKKGFSGELYTAHSSLDPSSLATGLWAWGLGLPVTGFLLGAVPGTAVNYSLDPVVADFNLLKPGVLPSLSIFEEIESAEMDGLLGDRPGLSAGGFGPEDSVAYAAAIKAIRRNDVASSPESARIIVRRTIDPSMKRGMSLAEKMASDLRMEDVGSFSLTGFLLSLCR